MNAVPPSRLRSLVEASAGKRIGVVGDLMLDIFTRGKSARLSPEAPVPVVLVESEQRMPGGAANVAYGVRALGAAVDLFGVVGEDAAGHELRDLASGAKIDIHFATDSARRTTVKHRIVMAGKHALRVDWEETTPLSPETGENFVRSLKGCAHAWDALIVADYAKGTVTEKLAEELVALAREQNIPIVVDTKPSQFHFYTDVSLLTPNRHEALEVARVSDILEAGPLLFARSRSPVLITRGAEGMTLFSGGVPEHLPARSPEVVDVSGAGDTVISVAALALAAGATLHEAMTLANVAAGIVVGKSGTATVSSEELIRAL